MFEDETNRHDFKNQLAIIRGFAEILLAEAPPDDPRRSDFQEIHNAVVSALSLLARIAPCSEDAIEPIQSREKPLADR